MARKRTKPTGKEPAGLRGNTDPLMARALDFFTNQAARTGWGTPNLAEGTTYPLVRFTFDYVTLYSLFESHWLARRIVEMPAQDCFRAWPSLTSEVEPKDLARLGRALERTNTKNKLLTAYTWARLYGGAGCLMVLDGQEDQLEEPLSLDDVELGAFKGVISFDRWVGISPSAEVCADFTRPLEFGLPEFYEVRANGGESMRVHASRVLRFTGPLVPEPENSAYSQWGVSVLAPTIEAIKGYDNLYANALALSFRALLIGVKWPELAQAMSGLGMTQNAVSQRYQRQMTELAHLISNQSLIPLQENGGLESTQYSFSGLSELMSSFQVVTSGAAQIPLSRLWGRTVTGLGSGENEGDEKVYAERIATDQATYIQPPLEKLYQVLCMSELGEVPDDLGLVFPSIRSLDEKEKADLAKSVVDSVTVCVNLGVMSPQLAAKEIKQSSDKTEFGTNLTDEFIARLSDEVSSEGELGQGDLFGGEGAGLNETASPAKAIKAENEEGKEEEQGDPARAADAGMRRPKEDERTKAGYSYDFMYKGFGLRKVTYPDGRTRVNIFDKVGEVVDAVASYADARRMIDGITATDAAEEGSWLQRYSLAALLAVAGLTHSAYQRLDEPRKKAALHQAYERLERAKATDKAEGHHDMAVTDLRPGDVLKVNGVPLTVRKVTTGTEDLFGQPTVQVSFEGGAVVPYPAERRVSIVSRRGQARDEDGPAVSARRVHGLDIFVETPKGGTRSGKGWSVTLPYDYGYFPGQASSDGDSLDACVGPESNGWVYCIDQSALGDRNKFDEVKVFLNWPSAESALKAFRAGHHKWKDVLLDWTPMRADDFKAWLKSRDPMKPCSPEVTAR